MDRARQANSAGPRSRLKKAKTSQISSPDAGNGSGILPPTGLASRFDVLRLLGQGASADVWELRDNSNQTLVALKVLRDITIPANVAAFQREFLLLTRLRHPGLVAAFDFEFLPDGRPCFTAELVVGRSLAAAAPLRGNRVTQVFLDLVDVVEHLHRNRLVHCDLKPENVVVLEDGRVKLLDLGLAQEIGQGRGGGTPAYMSPEILRGAKVDDRADLYSLGAVGYYLLTAQPPHRGTSAAEVIAAALGGIVSPLPDEVPIDLARAVMALLTKDPTARPSLQTVRSWLGQDPIRDTLPLHVLETPLLGRQAELEYLDSAFDKGMASRHFSIVRVGGVPGSGKDRLLSEFRSRKQAAGIAFATGSCTLGGENLHPFAQALRTLTPDFDEAWKAACDGTSSRSAFFATLSAVIARMGQLRPVAIHFADWQVADPASRAFLDQLAENPPPGQFVVFLTDRDAQRAELLLGPLSIPAVGEVASAMLGGAELDDGLAIELAELSEGNPLFLQGLLDQALTCGLFERVGERWRTRKPLATTALPNSLAGTLVGRLAGRSLEATALARVLAVFGHPIEISLLARVAQLEADAGLRAIDELESAGLLTLADGKAAFRHGAMAEALVPTFPETERLGVQGRIVLAIEGRESPDDREKETLLDDLARHSLAWDPADRGVRYGLAAARAHLRVYAVERARALLDRGVRHVAPESPMVEAYTELLADADRHAGAFEAARDRYSELVGRLPSQDPRRPRTLASLGLALQALSDYEAGMAAFEQACAEAQILGDPHSGLRALTSLARLAYLQGDSDKAFAACQSAVKSAREFGTNAVLCEALGLLGCLEVARDPTQVPTGLAHLEEALGLSRKLGDPVSIQDCLMLLGNARMLVGRPLGALQAFVENLQICRNIGAAADDAVTAELNIVLARLDLGAFGPAAAGARSASLAAQAAGNRDLVVYAQTFEAVAQAQLGRVKEGLALYTEARQSVRDLDSRYLEAAVLGTGAQTLLIAGSAMAAREDLDEALALSGAVGTKEFTPRCLGLLAEAYTSMGEFDRAIQACESLFDLARPFGECAPQVRGLLSRGEICLRLGELEAAESHFGEACGLAQQLGMSYEAALGALGRGRVRAQTGRFSAAREDLLSAQRLAAQTGCPHILVDALFALAQTTFDPAESKRYLEMADGHLRPLLATLDAAGRARYLGKSEHGAKGRSRDVGASLPAELEALVPYLDKPLRLFLGRIDDPGQSDLPVGDLVARLLGERPNPDEVLERTLGLARERFGAERCLAVLRVREEFEVRAMIPGSPDLLHFCKSFLDMALAQDRTLWTVDALADPRLSATESVSSLDLRAIACTPIRSGGRAVGALYLDWSDPSGGLSETGRREFETLAGVAGVCLSQAEMLAALEQRTEQLEIMNDLANSLAGTFSVDQLLELALKHSLTISGAQMGCALAGREFTTVFARDAHGNPIDHFRVSNTVMARLREEKTAFALIDSEAESVSASVAAEGLRSVMAVPVRVEGELRGAFYLASAVSIRGFGARDLALLEAVANQVAVALARVDMVAELARRERMSRELEIARDVQRGLMPKRLPTGSQFKLAAASLPALEVGGDFFDAISLPSNRIGLFIGDVAGKGVPAALLAASLLSGFRLLAPNATGPGEVLARLNDFLIASRLGPGTFASALYTVFDPATGELTLACAGHPAPLSVSVALTTEGPVLGLLGGMTFPESRHHLPSGSLMALYSDGLEDAHGPDVGSMTREDLERHFLANASDDADATLEKMLEIAGATNGAALYDDITVIVLTVGAKPSPR